MPTQKKIEIVKNLSQKLSESKSVVLADYQGLPTTQLEELQHKVEETGGIFMVAKNTLLQLALQKTSYQLPAFAPSSGRGVTSYQFLTGPTAILFSFKDEIAPIKALHEFVKKWELPKIKGGFLQKEFISAEKVKELAKLPGRLKLLAQLVAQLQTPTTKLVYDLKANLNRLVYTLEAIKEREA